MTTLTDKAAAVSKFGLPAGIVLAAINYFQMRSSGEAVDVSNLLTYIAGPLLGGWAVSSVSSPLEAVKSIFSKDKGQTLGLLESLKVIIEQFRAKGIPDQMSATVTWGDEVYEFDWAKRIRAKE